MRGGRQQAKPGVGRPLDGRVRRIPSHARGSLRGDGRTDKRVHADKNCYHHCGKNNSNYCRPWTSRRPNTDGCSDACYAGDRDRNKVENKPNEKQEHRSGNKDCCGGMTNKADAGACCFRGAGYPKTHDVSVLIAPELCVTRSALKCRRIRCQKHIATGALVNPRSDVHEDA